MVGVAIGGDGEDRRAALAQGGDKRQGAVAGVELDADAAAVQKAEQFEWTIEDKNTFVLSRCKKLPPRKTKKRKS